jgi:hypothetical protein
VVVPVQLPTPVVVSRHLVVVGMLVVVLVVPPQQPLQGTLSLRLRGPAY